jgi:hypothetical protein
MIISNIKKFKTIKSTDKQKIRISCDECNKEYEITLYAQKEGFKKYYKDLCRGCKQHIQCVTVIRKKQYVNAGISTKIRQKGKTFEEIHGLEKAKEIKEKLSKAFSGEKNPMFGKPAPQGSGNGWSGWYKGWFFRSLKELSYMINIIERFNLKWESAEIKKYKINYVDWNGNNRTYYADFIIENKYLVEIKPKCLWNSNIVKRKKEAALEFCNKHNLKYKLTESPKLIQSEQLLFLINEGVLKFTNKYQEKFKKWEN